MNNNTITIEDIKNLILETEYKHINNQVCICTVTLKNGFIIVKTSGKIHANGYNIEMGEKIALDNVISEIFLLEGYRQYCNYYKSKEDRKI